MDQEVTAVNNINLDAVTQQLSEEIMSPFCPGRTLQACPSEDARQLKLEIRNLASMGYSNEAIKRRLFTMYGEEISGIPQKNSFETIAWNSPLIFAILGLIFTYLGLRVMRSIKNSNSNNVDRVSIEDLNHLEKQLRD